MRSRVARLVVAVSLALPFTAGAPSRAAAGGAPCDLVDFSPAFSTDRTGVCGHQPIRYDQDARTFRLGAIQVYATTDAGRTWRRQAAAGLPVVERNDTGETLAQLLFSPSFTTDRLLYAYVGGSGLYASTDLGASWYWLDALLLGPGPVNHTALTRFHSREPAADGGSTPGGFTYAYGVGIRVQGMTAPINSLHLPPFRTQVQGGPGLTKQFLVPDGWPAVPAVAVTYAGSEGAGLYECDAALRCERQLYDPAKLGRVDRAWLAPDYATSGVLHVATLQRLYRSTDFGRTFAPWQPADRLTGPRAATIGLAFDRANPKRGTLRISRWWDKGVVEEVHGTTDGGARWTRMAYGTAFGEQRRGTLPFHVATGWGGSAGGVRRVGGRVFTVAAHLVRGRDGRATASYDGIWCSLDDGRTWARSCPR